MSNYLRRALTKGESDVDHCIKAIQVSLASPEYVREISRGEVISPETINYKTFKPEKSGLFCEAIFGPVKDFECSCGRYKKIKYRGRVCEKCQVCITESMVRREWMGHIELACPVTHIWMTKELPLPSKISLILGIKFKQIEEIVYFVNYVVLHPGFQKIAGTSLFSKLDVISLSDGKDSTESRQNLRKSIRAVYEAIGEKKGPADFEYLRGLSYYKALQQSTLPFSLSDVFEYLEVHTGLKVGIGAEAILHLLQEVKLDKLAEELKAQLIGKKGGPTSSSNFETKRTLKRLAVVKWFKSSGCKPEWMVLRALPVLPPDLRPIIQIDGDRFTASDINVFYRRIIIRNKRLARILDLDVAHIISGTEKRMLQESVDSLIDNCSRRKPLTTTDNHPLKSLTDHLKGKQGLFRQNLLGKRVDYSGRSVIVVGPTLKLYQVGLPVLMVMKLFHPFIIRDLIKNRDEFGNECVPIVESIREAEALMLSQSPEIWPVIHRVIQERPVLLNRAPTLHRLGIQAFEPVLIDGKAICLHPLVTTAFNADFDGDQMAVHLPLSVEAVAEARAILLSPWQVISPRDGRPIVTPTQDMLLGMYYLTTEESGELSGCFQSTEMAINSYELGEIALGALVAVHTSSFPDKNFVKEGWFITTPGKLVLNGALPKNLFFVNDPSIAPMTESDIYQSAKEINEKGKVFEMKKSFAKAALGNLIEIMFAKYDIYELSKALDAIKALGFEYSTHSCTTMSAFDIPNFQEKYELFDKAEAEVKQQKHFFDRGLISDDERYRSIVGIWNSVKERVSEAIEVKLNGTELASNSITVMAKSGARGNVSNFVQLSGMRGLMSKSYNYDHSLEVQTVRDIIEVPIRHSFIEGLSVIEYFNSSYGARKGMTDTAMKTAKSGYMTRKLVDAAQEVIVRSEECGTKKGLWLTVPKADDGSIAKRLSEIILFRTAFLDIVDEATGETVVKINDLITKEKAERIEQMGVEKVFVRSVLFCKQQRGVCCQCFGSDLTTHKKIVVGTAIGVISAQSIGEPATQLTMRTFHSGGVAGGSNITQGFERLKQLFDVVKPKKWEKAVITPVSGVVENIEIEGTERVIYVKPHASQGKKVSFKVNLSLALKVKVGEELYAGQILSKGVIDLAESVSLIGIDAVRRYIVSEAQKIYWLQGIDLCDKYIEVIVRQLTSKMKIKSSNDSIWLVDEVVEQTLFTSECNELLLNGKVPPTAINVIYGLEDISTTTSSFLSAASFQDTKKILTDAAVKAQIDNLHSLKENVIMGNLIPAGTGLKTPEEVIEMESAIPRFDY